MFFSVAGTRDTVFRSLCEGQDAALKPGLSPALMWLAWIVDESSLMTGKR
jgi:hypothetical protein